MERQATGAWAEVRRGWQVVLAGLVGVMFGISALPFYTLGVFVRPLEEAFGWSREAIQWGFTVQMLGMLCVAWALGLLTDRWGARRVALLSQAGLGLGFLGIAAVGSLPQWYAAWFVLALLGAGTSPIAWTRGVAGWFDSARGTALGVMLAGTGLTAVIAPPLVTGIVAAHGWRAGYLALAGGVILLAMPLTALLFRDPPGAGGAAGRALPGMSRREAFADRGFWIMLLVFFLVTFAVSGLIPTLVPLLMDRGFAAADAALYASLAGAAVIAGRIVAGVLLDRFWAPAVAAVFLLLPAASCLLLASGALSSPPLIALAVVLVGLAAGAEFDIVAYMVTRYFGLANYGLIYSQLMMGMLVGGGFGPPVFGRVFDQTGSYTPILLAAAAIFATVPWLLFAMGRYPSFAPARA
ncbi:MAG: MFS transporter [Thermaurantiacus tibetensis]|uniref:MFS transporter n=1 Tax=Thermaurantiacus tibetensis TaxID=2759035 RepID=UPI0018901A92|nr:MFS transporter [Thermaurantiacus tibetensis]